MGYLHDGNAPEFDYVCGKCGRKYREEAAYAPEKCACCAVLCGGCCKERQRPLCRKCVLARMEAGLGREFVASRIYTDAEMKAAMDAEKGK